MEQTLPTYNLYRLGAAQRLSFLFIFIAFMGAVPQARGQSVNGPTSVCLNATSGMVYANYYFNQGPGLCTVTVNSGWTVSSME